MKWISCLFVLMFAFCAMAASDNWAFKSQGVISVTGTSTLLIAANPYRQFLHIQNNGSQPVAIKLSATQTGTEGIQIAAGTAWVPVKPPRDAIYIISTSGTQSIYYIEGN